MMFGVDLQKSRCLSWLRVVFNDDTDVEERALRFGEEALELIQSLGVTHDQAKALVEQVYNKPVGDPKQELGGTMVTLASLCAVTELDAGEAFEREFDRCELPAVIEKIKRKHAQKAVVSSRFRP